MNERYTNIPFENYLEFALGIIERSIADYIQCKWWLANNPWRPDFTQKEAEKWHTQELHCNKELAASKTFFESQRFEMYTKGDKDIKGYLYDNMDKVAAIGPTIVVEGKERAVDNIFLDTAARMLTDRVREVVF